MIGIFITLRTHKEAMKSNVVSIVLALLFSILIGRVSAQTAEEVFGKFNDAIGSIENISYKINRIDTFTTGGTWNNTGYSVMKRQRTEPVFGFMFKAKRDDVDDEVIFDGSKFYFVNDKTKIYYLQESKMQRGILGSPGGQMVLDEFLTKIKDYKKLSLSQTDNAFILQFDFPDDDEYKITNRYREIHLDKNTYLPFYRYSSLKSIGSKQISIAYLSDVKVNDKNFVDPFVNKQFLADYAYQAPKVEEDKLVTLLDKPAPDFELTDLEGNKLKLSDQKNKVILLDFWEIWCGPCIKSIGALNGISKKYPKKKFEVWSIVSDEVTFSKVKDAVSIRGVDYKVLFGNKESSSNYFLSGVPMYLLVDREGRIRYAKLGSTSDLEDVIGKWIN